MKSYSQLVENFQVLEEGASQNGQHITHFEDVVFYGGSRGVKYALNLVLELTKSPKHLKVSSKYDGSPALFFGIDPQDGKFFVAKKSIFNKDPKVYKHPDSISSDGLAADLATKLQYAYHYLKPLTERGIYQADMLFIKGDKKPQTIDGTGYITFHPNTLTYGVPQDSDLFTKISNASLGLVLHTKWIGHDFKSMKPVYEFDKSRLRTSKKVWMHNPYLDISDVQFDDKTIKTLMQEILNKLPKISKFINDLSINQNLAYIFEAYHNSLIRNGHITNNSMKYVLGLQQFAQSKGKKYQSYFKDQKMLMNLFEVHCLLSDIKMEISKTLNKIEKKDIKTFIKKKDGIVLDAELEGFVVVGKNNMPLKFVDRLQFSHYNFDDENISKGWTK